MNINKAMASKHPDLVSCFRSSGRNHWVIVLTCWYRGAPNNVVQLDGSGGGPLSFPDRPGYYVSIKFMSMERG
jgi:hypothetical protein